MNRTKWLAFSLILGLSGCMREPDARESIEGKWASVGASTIPADRPVIQYRLDGERLDMSSSPGLAYSAELGGDEVALDGAPAGTRVAVEWVRAVAFREIVTRDGEPISVRLVTVADDRLATIFVNNLDGSPEVYPAIKR